MAKHKDVRAQLRTRFDKEMSGAVNAALSVAGFKPLIRIKDSGTTTVDISLPKISRAITRAGQMRIQDEAERIVKDALES